MKNLSKELIEKRIKELIQLKIDYEKNIYGITGAIQELTSIIKENNNGGKNE